MSSQNSGVPSRQPEKPPTLSAEVIRSASSSRPVANPPVTSSATSTLPNKQILQSTVLRHVASSVGSKNVAGERAQPEIGAEGGATSASAATGTVPKPRRKATPRTKKDTEESKNRQPPGSSGGGVAGPSTGPSQHLLSPAQVVVASAQPQLIVYHNGQCYAMPASYLGQNQQMTTVRPHASVHPSGTTSTASISSTHDFLKALHFHQQQQQQQHQQHQQHHQQQQQQSAQHHAVAAFAAQQQHLIHQHQVQTSQQYIRPNVVSGNATLGQLARSLAPKPVSSNNSSSSTPHNVAPASLTFQTVPTSALSHGTALCANPNDSQSISQIATPVSGSIAQQINPQSVFQQGIQIRPGTSSGIVLQMPNVAYTYVQHVVNPQQQVQGTVGQQQQQQQQQQQSQQTQSMPTFLATQAGPGQHQHFQNIHIQPNPSSMQSPVNQQQATVPLQTHSRGSQPSTSRAKRASDNSFAIVNSQLESQQSAPKVIPMMGAQSGSASNVPQPSEYSIPVKSNSRSCGKQSGASKAKANISPPKAHVPPTLAPSNLVPVGAPMPMMVMSTSAVPQMGTFAGPAVPVMGPNGQIIHQQLIPAAPMPTHQMIPVFQQQQNVPRPIAPQPPPLSGTSPGEAVITNGPARKRVGEDGTSGDSGAENEPPPLLVQGESKDALDVHVLFTKEAERYYVKAGRKGHIVHLIEGFEIEESDEPFPCEQPCRMEDWVPAELLDTIQIQKPAEVKSDAKTAKKEVTTPTSPKKGAKGRPSNEAERKESPKEETPKSAKESPKRGRGRLPAAAKKEETAPPPQRKPPLENKKRRKRKTNELQQLLQMDFGPSQGRLCDILSVDDEITTNEKEVPKPSPASAPPPPPAAPPPAPVEVPEVEEEKKEEKTEENKDADASFEENTSAFIADLSLNSSKGSSGEGGVTAGSVSFSDDELDTERCNYCNGLLRLKRCEQHPQYCSKKCRKLWKRNPNITEEHGIRSINASPRLVPPGAASVNPSPIKEPTTSAVHPKSITTPAPQQAEPSGPEQRSPPTLTLKMVSPQQAEIVKSPRLSTGSLPGEMSSVDIPPTSFNVVSHSTPIHAMPLPVPVPVPVSVPVSAPVVAPIQMPLLPPASVPTVPTRAGVDPSSMQFLERPAKGWTCDEVARWVFSVIGSEECATTFREQDIDGHALSLLADNPHHNLGVLLGLKLGPVVKIQNALRDLTF